MTFSVWVKTSGSRGKFVAKEIDNLSQFQFHAYLDPQLEIAVHNIQKAGTTPLNDNTWHHITTTYNSVSGDLSLYVDGVLESSHNIGLASTNEPAAPFTIGAAASYSSESYGRYFTGILDEIIVFNRALSPSEVLLLGMDADSNQIPDFFGQNFPTPTSTPTLDPLSTKTSTPTSAPTYTLTATPAPPSIGGSTWEQVIDGFYEGNRVNLFHKSAYIGQAAPADVDNDGDMDILLAGYYYVRYYRNDGTPNKRRSNPLSVKGCNQKGRGESISLMLR